MQHSKIICFFLQKYEFFLSFILFVLSTVVLYFFVFIPVLNIEITSNISSVAQVFYKAKKQYYSIDNSEARTINAGLNKLRISLPHYNGDIRFDPVVGGSLNATIHNISVNLPFSKFSIEPQNYNYQLQDVVIDGNEIKLISLKDSTDPQWYFKVEEAKINKIRLILTLLTSLLISLSTLFVLKFFNSICSIHQCISSNIEKMFNTYVKGQFKLSEFGILFGIAIVCHFFEMSNFLVSVDDEFAALRSNPEVWIGQGRWVIFLVEKYIFDQPTMPFVPELVFCALMSLSYMFLIKAHQQKLTGKFFLLYPIYVAFPSLWMITSFYGNITATALGFLCITIAIWMFMQIISSSNSDKVSILIIKLLLPSVFIAIALGSYQSFFEFAIVLGTGVFLLNIINNKFIMVGFVKQYVLLLLVIVIGIVLYKCIDKIFMFSFGIPNQPYIDGFINIKMSDLMPIFSRTYNMFILIYSGSNIMYGIGMPMLSVLFGFTTLVIICKRQYILLRIILFLIVLISPFILTFVAGGNMPLRAIVAIPYVVWLVGWIALSSPKFKIIGGIIVFTVLLQILSVIGQYAALSSIYQTHDRILADDIYRRMAASNPEFDREDMLYVDIYGGAGIGRLYPVPADSTSLSSIFEWDNGHVDRIIAYMKLQGYANLQKIEQDLMKNNNLIFEQMPTWPNQDSVQYIDGVYLIKLGKIPSVFRGQ